MSLENILSQEIIQKLGWSLLHFIWQATVVSLLAAVLLASLRKATANIRYIIACTALGLIVLLPLVTMPLVAVSPARPDANNQPPAAPAIAPMQTTEEIPLKAVESLEPLSPRSNNAVPTTPWNQRAAEWLEPALPYLVTGWLLGVFGLSLWHLGGWAQLQRLRRKLTRPIDASLGAAMTQLADRLGVGRAVELLESALVQVPTVVGWLRPVILLPASALTGLTPEQLEALLAHELAHIRRYDYLVNMVQTVIETLGFYHPAVWWVSHKIRIERENCCDDVAVGICGDRVRYARALTSMEEIRSGRSELAVAASGGNLLARIRRLVGKDTPDTSRTSWIPSATTILLIAIIAVPSTVALTSKSLSPKPEPEVEILAGTKEAASFESKQSSDTLVPQVRCVGKILDANSQPVERARVTLYVNRRGTNSFSSISPAEQATTSSDGSFSFGVPADSNDYTYGYIVAEKKGYALDWTTWNMRMGSVDLQIELGRPSTLAGTVVDENNTPVSDAQVSIETLRKAKQYLASPVAPMLLTTRTNPQGKFTFGNLPGETTADFVVRKAGRATIHTRTDSARLTYAVGRTDIKLVVPVEARIEGVVVERETRKPAAGIKLVVKDRNRRVQHAFDSKDDGTFSIDSLEPGKYKLEVLPPGEKLAEWVAEPVEVEIEGGKTATGVTIELVKGGILEIGVTDAISGKPVENANVTVLHKLGSQAGYSRTGKDGILQVRLMPGDYFLLDGISKQGYSPQGIEEPFTIADGKIERREYAIFPDSTLRGVIRDEKGRPLEGAILMIWPSERQQETVANAEGRFVVAYEMQNLSSKEVPILLLCRHERSNLATALEIDEGVRTLDVTLKPGMTLNGSVVDPDGKGIEGAELRVELCKPGLSWPIVPINPTRDEATTDKEGKFEIRAIPAGQEYRLSAKAKGYGNKRTDEINTSDASGNQFSLGNITLAVANLSVSGIVVDEGGKPVAGVTVNTYTDDQPYHVTKTDTDGKFTFEGVCAGRILILASKLGTGLHGSIYADGGATDAKIVISQKPLRLGYQPKQPPSLVGKPLPDLKELGVSPLLADMDDTIALICFFDMNQRPSRNMLDELAKREKELQAKGIVAVLVHTSDVEAANLKKWLDDRKISFACGTINEAADDVLFRWGVKAQPWLILTDREGIVRAEGLSLEQLDQKLEESNTDLQAKSDSSGKSRQGQSPDPNRPAVAKSPVPSGKDKPQVQTVRVELAVVEASSERKLDKEMVVSIRNILGGKITVSDSPAVADLLRRASEAMAAGKNELTDDKRVTQEQFNKLLDLLTSRGYLKILLRPTLEVVEGQTAQIKTDRNSLEVLVRKVKDNAIDLQMQADLSTPVPADGNDQTPMFSTRSFSTRVYINSGQSWIIGGLMRSALRTDADGDAKGPQAPDKEIMCIVTASITTPPANAKLTHASDFSETFRPRIIKLENSEPSQMVKLLTPLFAEESAEGVNIRDVILGENVKEKPDFAGPLSIHFMFEDMPGTNRIIVISNIPEAYDAVEQLVLELDKQKMAAKDVKQVRQWIAGLVRKGPLSAPKNQTTISGRCLDAGGQPLANALVQVYCRDSGQISITHVAESRTDSAGRFTLGPITAPGEEDWGHKSYFVFVPAEDHGPAWKDVNLYQETVEPLELTACNWTTVSGSVVAEDSKPVAGAHVWVRGIVSGETAEEPSSPVSRFSMHWPLPGWSAITDSNGSFRIAGVPDGTRLQLFVLHRDFAGRIVHVKAGEHTKIELRPAAVITGRVLYGQTGKPAAGIVVGLQRVDRDIPIPGGWMASGGPAVTDEQGRYRLESLPAGKYNVSAKAENLTVVALDSFEVKAGEVREAPDLVFIEGGFIAGRVIDEATGQPVKPGQRSSVAIYGPSHPESGAAVGSSWIRDDGSFCIRVAPGSNHIYLMPQEDWGQGRGYIRVDVAEGQTVEVELRARKLSAEELDKQAAFWQQLNSRVPKTLDELEYSANRLKQLGLAIAMYANEHDDTLPDGLQQLEGDIQDQELYRWLLENVEYLGKGKTGRPNAARTPIAYDRTLLQRDYSDYNTEVLFLDFSVRFVGAPELRDLGITKARRPTQTEPNASNLKQSGLTEVEIPAEDVKTGESARRLSSIGRAMLAYAKDHDGKYPAKTRLYELQEYLKTVEYAWPNQYEYLADGRTTSDRADIIIYYDTQLFEQGKGTNVLFNDGRVEFLGPERLNELNINKTQILIETRILEVTDDFLEENRLDANSVRTGEIRSAYHIVNSAAEPNSLPYCLVFDDNDVDLLLKGMGTPQGKDNKMLAAPQALVLDGRPITIEIIREIPVPVPGDPNGDSGKAESKPKRLQTGTFIKITPDALPDSNNVLLDFEWEHSQVGDFVQRIGPGGKKQEFPVIDRYTMRTRATVPDGKTLLIGGKKIRRLVVTSTKKPLLGDLPLIGSLFRSESRLEETRNVLILIKPTVDPKKNAEAWGASEPGPVT